jgi:hypothetical protein
LLHVFALDARLFLPLIRDVTLPLVGRVELLLLTAYFLVALLLYSAVVLELTPVQRKLRALLIAPACAGFASRPSIACF